MGPRSRGGWVGAAREEGARTGVEVSTSSNEGVKLCGRSSPVGRWWGVVGYLGGGCLPQAFVSIDLTWGWGGHLWCCRRPCCCRGSHQASARSSHRLRTSSYRWCRVEGHWVGNKRVFQSGGQRARGGSSPPAQRTQAFGFLYLRTYVLRRLLTSTTMRMMQLMSNTVATSPNPMANLLTRPEQWASVYQYMASSWQLGEGNRIGPTIPFHHAGRMGAGMPETPPPANLVALGPRGGTHKHWGPARVMWHWP